MREISTEYLKVGEHIIVDGVEYVAEEDAGDCKDCDLFHCGRCFLIPCQNGVRLKRVKKHPTETQDKDTPMTHHELAEWLAKGNGQYRFRNGYTECPFWIGEKSEEDLAVGDILIRPWGTDEWVKPTVEIYERDCKK